MHKIILSVLLLFPLVAFAGTAPKKKTNSHKKSPITMTTTSVQGNIKQFSKMMATKHGFDEQETYEFLIKTTPTPDLMKFFKKKSAKKFTPEELEHFRELAKLRVEHGVQFWKDNKLSLIKAEKEYGIPPEVIVGLIGIETNYGSYLGKFKEHEVLVSLSFYNNYRQNYFRIQLEHFLILAKDFNWDRTAIPCSYAGAIGIPQFMPNNMKPYAVDWNDDGQIDLMNESDAIGSVANFLSKHGWVANEPVATSTTKQIKNKTFVLRTLPGPHPSIWKKEQNFYIIRRYNPLNSYVMSIFILATKVKDEMIHQPDVLDELQIVVPVEDEE